MYRSGVVERTLQVGDQIRRSLDPDGQADRLGPEIVVDDGQVERAIEAIQKAAHTGKIGDGKIFVTPVEQALRIRTGETGSNAL